MMRNLGSGGKKKGEENEDKVGYMPGARSLTVASQIQQAVKVKYLEGSKVKKPTGKQIKSKEIARNEPKLCQSFII